jgi:hypothetical protein
MASHTEGHLLLLCGSAIHVELRAQRLAGSSQAQSKTMVQTSASARQGKLALAEAVWMHSLKPSDSGSEPFQTSPASAPLASTAGAAFVVCVGRCKAQLVPARAPR